MQPLEIRDRQELCVIQKTK